MDRLPALLKMRPFFRPVVWGGRGLSTAFGKPLPVGARIGESFEISAVPGMESVVASGPLEGTDLRTLAASHGADLLGRAPHRRYEGEFPLLIKLLDANDDLSIQVHPDDAYTRANRLGSFGKMEAWYVLKSEDGRVVSGLKPGIDRNALAAAVEAGRVEEAVEFQSVSEGDVVYLRPGTVHALCRGVMVYEVQQSSSITFRLYDYNRPDEDGSLRELHIDRSLDVIRFGEPAVVPAPVGGTVAVESELFVLEQHDVDAARSHDASGSFSCLTIISGSAEVRAERARESLDLADTLLVPAGRPFEVHPIGGRTRYLLSTVPT